MKMVRKGFPGRGNSLCRCTEELRKHTDFRELRIQFSMLAALYGRRQDEAGEIDEQGPVMKVLDCYAVEFKDQKQLVTN